MGFVLRIEMLNDAFKENNGATELARILRECASRIEMHSGIEDLDMCIFDINGNKVGKMYVVGEVDDYEADED